MPRMTPCRRCSRPLYTGPGSLPQPMCRPCRRIAPQRKLRPSRRCVSCDSPIRRRSAGRCYVCRGDRPPTDARGYGYEHQLARRRHIETFTPGDPCARCGDPMLDPASLDLDHTDDRTGYRGLSHRWCNRGKGPVLPPSQPRTRPCAICAAEFTARHRGQQSCSRACGVEVRRRNAA